MVQIGKDYYEDLTAESFAALLDAFVRGEVPRPGPQNGRFASEPVTGRTSLFGDAFQDANASVELALARGDTIGRVTGEAERREMRERRAAPGAGHTDAPGEPAGRADPKPAPETRPDRKERAERPAPLTSDKAEVADDRQREEAAERQSAHAVEKGNNGSDMPPRDASDGEIDEVMPAPPGTPSIPRGQPELLAEARPAGPDDLKLIKGIGPKLEGVLNGLGVWHFDQIASWGPDEIAWVTSHLNFRGRIERESWVAQAKELAERGGPHAADRGE
jgi:NADH-quinone oxidoreductase subunit E